MAKNKVFLHIGPGIKGVERSHDVLAGHPALAAAKVAVPDVAQEDVDRASIEILRRHKAHGMKRREVEGAWAHICRRAFKRRSDVVISEPDFIEADYQQVALALDGLVGLKLHLVLTPADHLDEAGLAALLGEWAKFVKKHARVHVVPVGEGITADEFAHEVAKLAVQAEQDEVNHKLDKLKKKRRKLSRRLEDVDAA